ncbi:hypothetical protein DERP_006563 [Dermatophagoides pteronyssinus]|uniref:Platelet-derived growth factor receptor-like protein n=1 Tax=Dermatophagoides pteronyssinus TaxID=6956 RepID=A0ABQ8IQZ0_DERPT|nr:hypothetical protein DERP_006563 [Dermatophagoides pteronyssinus]
MYSKFIEIINHFLDDIQANEPYVLRRLIPMAIDNQDNYCIQPLFKCEEFYCHNNTIIGPVIKQWKQHYHQQQSSKLIDNDQQQKQLIQEFYRHIGVWLIVIDYHRQRFEHGFVAIFIYHIVYRLNHYSMMMMNDDDENISNDNYIHNDFALRVSISIVYHLIQYRLYLLDRFFICLKEIQKLSSKLIQPSSSVSSGQQLRMIINTTTTNALTAAATTSRDVYMPTWTTISPKIVLISHQIDSGSNSDTIDISAKSTIHLQSTISNDGNHQLTEIYNQPSSSTTTKKISHDSIDKIFIFINDPEHLIVPYENVEEYMFLALFQSYPATIPCRPTYSKAEVTLWKESDNNQYQYQLIQIKPNSSLGITYDPRKGFHFDYPRWDSSVLECRYRINITDNNNGQYQQYEAKSTISLHWSILPIELHPIIDDQQARHIFINDTFTLRCFVHIDIGVIIVVDWDYPQQQPNQTKRIIKSSAETTRQLVNNNSYDTVAINITVLNATKNDEGIYRCNATDGNGRTFSTTKRIVIFDEHLVSSVNFTKDFHEPIIGECDHDIHFTIQAYAFPDISFINLFWYKDNNPLLINTNDSHIQMNLMNFSDENQTQITLYIISARPSDSGVYTLVGQTSWSSSQQQQQQNESITNKISIPVYIEGDIEILIENHQNFYQLNHTYELLCKSYGYPHPSIQWQWHPCETVHSCLNDDDHNDDNQIKWYNITTLSSMLNQDNDAKIIQINNETIVPYLNKSRLALKARQSGVYRCLSTLINMNNDNNHTIVKHQEIPFIVMDDEDLFKITSSTNEPTVNDTIILTCKASVYRYSQLWWVNTRLDTDVINPVNVNTMLEQKNQSNDPLIESISLSNDQNEYSLSSTLILTSVTLNHSSFVLYQNVDILTPSTPDSPNNKDRFDYFIANNNNGCNGISYVDLLHRQQQQLTMTNSNGDYINTTNSQYTINNGIMNQVVSNTTGIAYYNANYGNLGIGNSNNKNSNIGNALYRIKQSIS